MAEGYASVESTPVFEPVIHLDLVFEGRFWLARFEPDTLLT